MKWGRAARDVLAGAGLAEEGVEGVVAAADGLVRGHLAVRLDAVLEAVQLPAGVADLHARLADVDGDNFAHLRGKRERAAKGQLGVSTVCG